MTNDNGTFVVPRDWTPEQALSVFEWLHGIACALRDAYDDELLDASDARGSGIEDPQLELPF